MEPKGSLQCLQEPHHWSLSSAGWISSDVPPYFCKIHYNLPSTHRSSNWSLPFRFSNQNFVCISQLSHLHLLTIWANGYGISFIEWL